MLAGYKKEIFLFALSIIFLSYFSSAAMTCTFNTTCVFPSFPVVYVQNETGGFYNAHAQNTTLVSLEGLLGWYRLDNVSAIGENSTRVFDWSGNGLNGTVTGNAVANASGKIGGGYTFDGSNDYIGMGNAVFFSRTNMSFTMSAWVAPANTSCGRCDLMGVHIFTSAGASFRQSGTGLSFIYNGAGVQTVLAAPSVFATGSGVWHHIVGVYNSSGNASLYIDGVLNQSSVVSSFNMTTNQFVIGQTDVGNNGWNGTVDEVMIYNRSLGASEVVNLYNQTFKRYNYALCCSATEGNLTSMTCAQSTVIKLQNYTNSHVQISTFPGAAYTYPVCLASSRGRVQCSYSDGSCSAGYSCMASVASSELVDGNQTNSHIGACAEYYKKICCRVNNPPDIQNVILNSTFRTNYTNENLTLYFNESDFEGDFYTNITDWRVNGSSIAILNMPLNSFENSTNTGAVEDYSTYGNNGTLGGGTSSAAPAWSSSGKIGGGYTFDGGDSILIPNSSSIATISGNLSVTVWATSADGNAFRNLIYQQTDQSVNDASYSLRKGNNNRTFFDINISGTRVNIAESSAPALNTWTFYAATFNGASAAFYKDGALQGTSATSGSIYAHATKNLSIAGSGGYSAWNGSIDEVSIFNRSLSPEQIREMYLAGMSNLSLQRISENETSKGQNWTCLVTGNDMYDGTSIMSNQLIIRNTLPTVTLTSPADGNLTTNRTPMFSWTGFDLDGDTLTYEINLTTFYDAGSTSLCTDIRGATTANSFYIPSVDLSCLKDNGVYYVWSVRANDGEGNGTWSASRIINISALTTISLPVRNIDFGSMAIFDINDTSDDAPAPFVIQNDGNSLVNINASANNLWQSISNPSQYYRFKIDNVTGETFAFNWSGSKTIFTNMTLTELPSIDRLNYSNIKDSAEIDIYVQVPPNEPPAARNSTAIFYSYLAET